MHRSSASWAVGTGIVRVDADFSAVKLGSRSSVGPIRDGAAGTAVAIKTKSELTVEEQPAIYWHRDLPPFDAQAIAEHVVEASSPHVPDTIAHREELWSRCAGELMSTVRERLRCEITRLGGRYAHVVDESIETRHNPGAGDVWLHGRFTYMLYR
jgi:hypothetical protein